MSRQAREHRILEIVQSRPIRTQEELVRALEAEGFEVTQATVSRDIKRLGLVKIPDRHGYRYAPPTALLGPPPTAAEEQLRQAFAEFVLGVEPGEALLVVKTRAGGANAVAVVLDAARLPEVAGTIAGDDTILVVLRRAVDRPKVARYLRALLPRALGNGEPE